jgi:hypothetical protein
MYRDVSWADAASLDEAWLVQQFSNCSWGATRASHRVFNGVSMDV